MVRPSLRVAKTKLVRVPSSKEPVIRKTIKKTKRAHCGKCRSILGGVPTGPQSQIRKLPRSQRLPTRLHAGYLCSRCLRNAIKTEVRKA